jgi:5-methyltetrahydropteroyltriglutamate--homocysteine methyltransferase
VEEANTNLPQRGDARTSDPEYASARDGGFESRRFVPKDKIVVLGLLSTKNSDIETVDDLKRRIEQASK